MRDGAPAPLGGKGKVLEVDETFLGRQNEIFVTGKGWQKKRGYSDMMKVVSLVERGGGVRSVKVENLNINEIVTVLAKHADPASTLHTDEAMHYRRVGKVFDKHETVQHKIGEYVRGSAHTNTIEGYFSIFKRGMKGVYQHCGEQHLQRYLHEFDFRYSNRIALGVDHAERTTRAIKSASGKRPRYRGTDKRATA
jgi:transposase-like protein